MKTDDISHRLAAIEKRLATLEQKTTVTRKQSQSRALATSLPDCIISIRSNGFFKKPRSIDEVHEHIQNEYSCEVDRVSMALLRLAKRRELRKCFVMKNDRKFKAFVW